MWCAVVCAIGGAAARVRAVDRVLLAHAAGDALWVAQIVPRPSVTAGGPLGGPPPSPGPSEQTEIRVRHSQPGRTWRLLDVIPGRVTSMAARESQLAVLLSDGQWMTVFAEGSSSGQPLPAGGQLRVLADDGQTLWAVGAVTGEAGGLAAARADLARQALTTRPVFPPLATPGATRPTTTAATPVEAAGPATRLVLFRQTDGRWAAESELPAELTAVAADDLSVTVLGRSPTVAYRAADGSIRTLRCGPDGHGWETVGQLPATGHRVAAFELLADATIGPLLWTTTGAGDPGQVRDPARGGVARTLPWVGPPSLTGPPVAAVSGGYLRVIGTSAAKLYEQRYELTGTPVGTPAEVFVPPDLSDSPVLLWVQAMLLASLAFTIGTSVYRQVTPGGAVAASSAGPSTDADDSAPAGITPAPLSARAAAGGIDLLPLAVGVLAAMVVANHHPEESVPAASVWLVVAAAAVYLAHTTALESLTARSAGKWLTGLRVATPDGGRPAVWQLVTRNLLRVLDPLVWIVLSPLRQRTADVLAGTVVVRDARPPSPNPPEAGA